MTLSERIFNLSVLWRQVNTIFPYFDRPIPNWDALYREYLDKVMGAQSNREYHLLLAEFMNMLGDGHTDYMLPKSLINETGFLPYTMQYVAGDYFLKDLPDDLKQYQWAKILSVNGKDIADLLKEAYRYIYHVGNYASPSKLQMIFPFLLQNKGNEMVTTKGTFLFDLDETNQYKSVWNDLPQIEKLNGNILNIRLDTLRSGEAADAVRVALNQHPNVNTVVLDLRENIGGMTMNGAKIAELFISGEFSACQKRTRVMKGIDAAVASQLVEYSKEALEKMDNREELKKTLSLNTNTCYDNYCDHYGKKGTDALYHEKLFILTSRNTLSAAEDTVAMFRSTKRAVIVGTPTQGTTGTPCQLRFDSGAMARICSVAYRLLDGTEFIGCGIQPDVWIEPQISDFATGHDAAMEYVRKTTLLP